MKNRDREKKLRNNRDNKRQDRGKQLKKKFKDKTRSERGNMLKD